jgi:hypothetical protein
MVTVTKIASTSSGPTERNAVTPDDYVAAAKGW